MGTRNNPGAFNCYAAALPDEEIFTVLARDPAMPATILFWVGERSRLGKIETEEDCIRLEQATEIARKARKWRQDNLNPTGDGVPSWKLPRQIVDDADPIRSLPEDASDYNAGQVIAKVVAGIRQEVANLRGRVNREVEVVNDEHGYDLEAMDQYADRLDGYATELADLGIVDDRVCSVPSNWEVSDTDDRSLEDCRRRFDNIEGFRGAPPVELRAPILIHEGQRYTGTAYWRDGKLVLDNVEPMKDQVILETEFQEFTQGSDGLEPTSGRMTDAMFLQWIHERLVNVHGENRLYDYMHRFRDIIGKVRDQEIVTNIQERLGGETRHLDLAPEAGKTPVPDQIDTAPQDLSHRPEVPGERFSSFVKGQTFAYAKGLEVSPQHLPAALDAMAKDGWYLLAIFGQTDTEHVGFIFHRFPTEIVIPSRIVDTGDENTLLGTIERNRESIRRAIHGGEFGYSPHDDEFGNSDCGLGRQQEP